MASSMEEGFLKVTALAPGKTILVGEHFVVYGEAAVVMAINRHVQVTIEERDDPFLHISSDLGVSGLFMEDVYKADKGHEAGRRVLEPIKISAQTALDALAEKRGLNIHVHSTLPMAVGLGSSGALAVATVTAVGKLFGRAFSEEEILALSTGAEKFVHVNPSGIDQAISTYGGVIVYKKHEGMTRLNTASAIPLVIGNTGIQRNTGNLVDGVRAKGNRFPEIMKLMNNVAGQVSQRFIDALQTDDLNRLGELMDLNHGLLVTIGVSNNALDTLVAAAKTSGALGAKLTGAGGGGCIIALSSLEKREQVSEAIRRAGGTPMIVEKEDKGVRCWMNE